MLKLKVWQVLVVLSAITLAVYLPLEIVIKTPDDFAYNFFYWLFVVIFFLDVFVNYFFPLSETSDEIHLKQLRSAYLKSWFIVDLLAAIPFEFIFFESRLRTYKVGKVSSRCCVYS